MIRILPVRFAALPVVLVAAVIGVLADSTVLAQDATPTTQAGVVAKPSQYLLDSLADCKEVAALQPGAPLPVPDGATAYTIDSQNSEARYVAQEELARIGANTAVGKTNAFVGQFLFDSNGKPLPCSRFDVDLRTLQSDESRRDNFLRNNTLQSDTYPLATFIVRAVDGLDAAPPEGQEVTFYLIGDLTAHNVTRLAVWEVKGTFQDGQFKGTAFTEFDMADFGIDPPTVGPVMSISDPIRLEVDIAAKRQG